MKRFILALVLCLLSFPTFSDPSAPSRDYEGQARKFYRDDPDYAKRWPVEFNVRISEGLMFDLTKSLSEMGIPYYDDLSLQLQPILLQGIGPKPSVEAQKDTSTQEVPPVSAFFAPEVEFGWATAGKPETMAADVSISKWLPDTATKKLNAQDTATFWKAYLSEYRFLDRVFFKIKKGTVPADGTFDALVAFEFGGREAQGPWRHDFGRAKVLYTRTDAGWRISRWVVTELTSERRATKMFENVTKSWLASLPEDVRLSLAIDSVDNMFFLMKRNPRVPIQFISDSHPKVSVVDIDDDGWDDLFLWDAMGESLLLQNAEVSPGKRGFVDATRKYGLGFRDVQSAVFADLNNDGIKDVIIGRWASKSEIYLGTRDTQDRLLFVPSDANRTDMLPSEVSSVAVSDVNMDGYLDIYFATTDQKYAQEHTEIRTSIVFHRAGPNDVLLINLGNGQFNDLTERFGLKQQRATLAAAFCDFNNDGYPDLALGNDFGETQMFLNEGGAHFREVSKETGSDNVYFGMGLSWGDYDNDGDMDLYVTAMQSTAGQRVTGDESNIKRTDVKEQILLSPRGNILLRNNSDGTFTDVTSDAAYSVVRNANWAYGAQFTDFNNDSNLDIFSPNGFFTYPRTGNRALVRDF